MDHYLDIHEFFVVRFACQFIHLDKQKPGIALFVTSDTHADALAHHIVSHLSAGLVASLLSRYSICHEPMPVASTRMRRVLIVDA